MSLRREFVLRALSGGESISLLCREYEISRKTGYKWIKRFKERGLDGLVDDSRRPKNSPLQVSAETTLEILRIRKAHNTWGPKKIWGVLRRSTEKGKEPPSVRTIARVLVRSGRAPSFSIDAPNDLWTVDFKGWWKTADGAKCEPLTIRDARSRFILAVRLLPKSTAAEVRRVFEELFERWGVPRAILSDNGQPWASVQTPAGLTKLSAWWVSLGIEVVRTRVGCPQDNGAHERMHADIRIEIQDHAAPTRQQQQVVCDEWVQEFNYVRPHEALGQIVPADIYRKSPRKPKRIAVGGLPPGCEAVPVRNCGWLDYQQRKLYVTTAIAGYCVGIQHIGDQAIVWFYDLPLGIFRPKVDERIEPFTFETCHRKPRFELAEDGETVVVVDDDQPDPIEKKAEEETTKETI